MNCDDVRCREVVAFLTDYLEDDLAPELRIVLEQHLLVCGPCCDYLEQMRTSIALTGRLREEDVPSSVMERVMEMLGQAER